MPQNNAEFVIARVFDAPRERVWQAWTSPEKMAQWWGPKGFKVSVTNMDLRPGGTYHYCLKPPVGNDMWGKFEYLEVNAPSKLLFVSYFSDAKGGVTRHPMAPTWPEKTQSTILFEEEGGKTKLTIKWLPLNPTPEEAATFEAGRTGMNIGWGGTLDQLTTYLAEKAAA